MMKKNSRRWKRKVFIKHHQNHWGSLLRDTLPLFVAATISRAVTEVINAIDDSGHIQIQIFVMFLYSLLVAHVVGYAVNLYVPLEHSLANYYVDIANDNASFAWSTTITLITLNWLYKTERAGVAIAAWILQILIVCLIIYSASYVQRFYLKPTLSIHNRLRVFESEAFALSLAYSITVIVASTIYRNDSTDYLSNTDDLNPITDDDEDERHPRTWYFFMYTVVISLLMMFYQRHLNNFKFTEQHGYSHIANAAPINTAEHVDNNDETFIVENYNEDEDFDESFIEDYIVESNDIHTMDNEGTSKDCNTESSGPVSPVESSYFQKTLFGWDSSLRCRKTYESFYYTFIGYLVSSAWTVWALLTFQNLFQFSGGQQFGLLLYALTATVIVASLMTSMTAKKVIKEIKRRSIEESLSHQDIQLLADTTHGEFENSTSILYIAFARLTVGWAWQEFFSSVIGAMIPDESHGRASLLALTKCLFAVFVFILGAYVEYFLQRSISAQQFRVHSTESNLNTPLI